MGNNADKYDVIMSMMMATKAELESVIETQTLLQLLVKKGICTPDEIKTTRQLVERKSPRVKRLYYEFTELDKVATLFEKGDEEKHKFMYTFGKMIHDRDSLTEEELDYLDSKLDFKKYWDEDKKDSNQ